MLDEGRSERCGSIDWSREKGWILNAKERTFTTKGTKRRMYMYIYIYIHIHAAA